MLLSSICAVGLAGLSQATPTPFDTAQAFAKVLDYTQSLTSVSEADVNPFLEVQHSFYDATSGKHRKRCILHPVQEGFDDDNLMKAVEECGKGGIIRLPDAN